jgi:ferritin
MYIEFFSKINAFLNLNFFASNVYKSILLVVYALEIQSCSLQKSRNLYISIMKHFGTNTLSGLSKSIMLFSNKRLNCPFHFESFIK